MLPVSGTRIDLSFQSPLICSTASLEPANFVLAIFSVCSDSWNTFNSYGAAARTLALAKQTFWKPSARPRKATTNLLELGLQLLQLLHAQLGQVDLLLLLSAVRLLGHSGDVMDFGVCVAERLGR